MEKISKNYQNTLFNDAELKTSKHDEIVLFAYNNFDEILKQIMNDRYYLDNHKGNDFGFLKSKEFSHWRLKDKILEYPLRNLRLGQQYINGFIDLYIRYSFREKTGFNGSIQFLIEAKSKKPFIGDIVRQINFYKSMTHGIFILIAPDILNEKEILSEQGILSFNYCL